MLSCGDLIDNTLGVRFGLATLTAAACGQVFSDLTGVCFGGVVQARKALQCALSDQFLAVLQCAFCVLLDAGVIVACITCVRSAHLRHGAVCCPARYVMQVSQQIMQLCVRGTPLLETVRCAFHLLVNVDHGTFVACSSAVAWCQVCTVRYMCTTLQ